MPPPEKFEWIRFYEQKDQSDTFDLTAFSSQGTFKMDLPLKTLNILSSDFYDHFHVGTLFAKLHPDEHYNHENSPHRIYDTVRRLRDYLIENKIPIAINNYNLTYRLFFTGPCSLRVWVDTPYESENEDLTFLKILEKHFGTSKFTTRAVAEITNLPIRTVQRKLKQISDKNYIEKMGEGKKSFYRIKLI